LFEVLLAAQNYDWKCSGDGNSNCNYVSFTDPDENEMGNSEQVEGENISHDQKMGESS
jgi:hypothetical protein